MALIHVDFLWIVLAVEVVLAIYILLTTGKRK